MMPRYAIVKDGNVIVRRESFALIMEEFKDELRDSNFLTLTIQNTRAIAEMADTLIDQSKTRAWGYA